MRLKRIGANYARRVKDGSIISETAIFSTGKPHKWQHYENPTTKGRYCPVCHYEEVWDDDVDKWIWISNEDYMSSDVMCLGED